MSEKANWKRERPGQFAEATIGEWHAPNKAPWPIPHGVYTKKGHGAVGRIPAQAALICVIDWPLTNRSVFHRTGVKTCRLPILRASCPLLPSRLQLVRFNVQFDHH